MNTYSKLSCGFLAILVCVASPSLRSRAQSSPNESEIDRLATRTAERVAKTQAHRVLVLTVQGCLLDANICGALDQKIRTQLQMAVSGVQLFGRGDLLPLLPKHGFLPVDGYTNAVEAVAPDLRAEIMVTESLIGIDGGYEVSATVTELAKHKKLDEFKAKLTRSPLDSSAEPLIFREPADGPALVVPRMRNSARKGDFPTCEQCAEPGYTDEARAKKIEGIVLLVITITEQGTAEHISVIRGLDGGLTESAVRRVGGWRFKPAVGPDGKPLATRTPIEVNFRLLNH